MKLRPWVRNSLYTLLLLLTLGSGGVGFLLYKAKTLPSGESVSKYQPKRVTSIEYVDGKRLSNSFNECYMETLPDDKISDTLINVILNSEDESFFNHPGVNGLSIIRAIFANLQKGKVVQGASTIDIQVASLLLEQLDPNYKKKGSFEKKIDEMIFALKLQSYGLTKKQKIQLYTQIVPTFRRLCGFASFTREMLGIEPEQAKLEHVAMFAAGFPGPYFYDPLSNPKAALKQRNITIDKVVRNGLKNKSITEEGAKELLAIKDKPLSKYLKPSFSTIGKESWAALAIQTELATTRLPSQYVGKGYKITTTIDPKIQSIAENKMESWRKGGVFNKNWEVGLYVYDADTFEVLGIVGDKNKVSPKNQYSNVFSFARAASMGKIAIYSLLYQDRVNKAKLKGVDPDFGGIYTLSAPWKIAADAPIGTLLDFETSFAKSLNTVAISAFLGTRDKQKTPGQKLKELYSEFGVQFNSNPEGYAYFDTNNPQYALGTFDISLNQVSTVHAAVMNGGYTIDRIGLQKTPFTTIKSIHDYQGNLIMDNSQFLKRQVLDKRVANKVMGGMIEGVTNGTGKAAFNPALKRNGTKTGTDDNSKLVGIVHNGIYPKLALQGEASRDRNIGIIMRIKDKKNQSLGGGVYGGTLAGPLVGELSKEISSINSK
jgi:membrane peptidoglycan carboxypeptidase